MQRYKTQAHAVGRISDAAFVGAQGKRERMNRMKKQCILFAGLLLAATLAACGGSVAASGQFPAASAPTAQAGESETTQSGEIVSTPEGSEGATAGRALVAYFAYSENMGDIRDMGVDAIASASLRRSTDNAEGNLQVMAQVLAEETGADVFHILLSEPYNHDYETMLPVAIEQLQNEDWPPLQASIENLQEYEVIYLGTPVWNAVLPPALHTFFAENDLTGKTIVPFGIHLGSGFGRMLGQIEELAPGAALAEGFTVQAGTANSEVEGEFRAWLEEQQT